MLISDGDIDDVAENRKEGIAPIPINPNTFF